MITMKINLFQLLTCGLFSLFVYRYVRKAVSVFDYLFIGAAYVAFNAVLFNPYLLINISEFFGIGRGVDLFLYISILTLFFVIIQLMKKIDKNREDISRLNRRISILMSERKHD